jgi:hypothetical protein
MDLFDLKNSIARNTPVAEIADFLCRSEQEVREKIAELQKRWAFRLAGERVEHSQQCHPCQVSAGHLLEGPRKDDPTGLQGDN